MLAASSHGPGVCYHVAHSARLSRGPEVSPEMQAVLLAVDRRHDGELRMRTAQRMGQQTL